MNIEQLGSQFWQQGYLVLDQFFEPSLMDEVDREILQYFGDDPEFWHEEEFLANWKNTFMRHKARNELRYREGACLHRQRPWVTRTLRIRYPRATSHPTCRL